MPRKKLNKTVQKSISLTEQDWALIEKIGEGSGDKSNSAVVMDMIISHIFLNDLINENQDIRVRFWEYYYEAVAMGKERIFEKPYEENFRTLLDKRFPKFTDGKFRYKEEDTKK